MGIVSLDHLRRRERLRESRTGIEGVVLGEVREGGQVDEVESTIY